MNKKAALELGINTVVILVIALVIVGGGIAFITGLFDVIDKEVRKIEMPNFPASAGDQIVLADKNPELKMGTKEYLDINIYNGLSSDREIDVVFGKCTTDVSNPGCETVLPVLVTLSQIIPQGEDSGFRTSLKANCASKPSLKLAPGDYVCSIKSVTVGEPVETISEKQVIIKVTN